MNAGMPMAMMPSVASMWFSMANQMMNATETRISNGARQSSASIDWMIDCMTCGSPVARDINCPTSIRAWNSMDCSWIFLRRSWRKSMTTCDADQVRQYWLRKMSKRRTSATSGMPMTAIKTRAPPIAPSSRSNGMPSLSAMAFALGYHEGIFAARAISRS